MFSPKALFILSLLFFPAWPLVAQVHEETAVDLARGLVLRADQPPRPVPQQFLRSDQPPLSSEKTGVAQKAFAVTLLARLPAHPTESVIASQGDEMTGWRFLATADGALRFEARTKGGAHVIAVSTPPAAIHPGATHHLALNILRDATRPSAGIWVDGVELASGVVPPADLSSPQLFKVGIPATQIRLYHRDLHRPEVMALWLDAAGRGKPVAKHPAPPANGPRFVPRQDETIALIGGTEAVALAESGELEAMLLMAFPETRFHFRCLAWEGDTVFRQDRPMNFGDLTQQLRRVNAGSVFIMFGRQECLDLPEIVGNSEMAQAVDEFTRRFTALLREVKRTTPNCVVMAPPAFDMEGPGGSRFMPKNNRLKTYKRAMNMAAAEEGILCWVDYNTYPELADHLLVKGDYTRDGVNLTTSGCSNIARQMAANLGITAPPATPTPTVSNEVLFAIRAKNRLWHDYWRPTNWAFLHGDRTQQPSSRDHVNPQLRFFPAEQEKYLPLIKEAEEKVYKLVEEATKKLP